MSQGLALATPDTAVRRLFDDGEPGNADRVETGLHEYVAQNAAAGMLTTMIGAGTCRLSFA